jgi:diadenosine tetraphosphate (Ap4A) HIT family hydrolase
MNQNECIFCNPRREILAENAHALAFFDSYPVSRGHALVVPRRHALTIFELEAEEYADCFRLVLPLQQLLRARFAPDGFNVGANCGAAAGQSVWHAHIHVIPRYQGDVPNPRGGVRGVIPHKAGY